MRFRDQTNSYYFDKALGWAFIMAMVKGLILTWGWPVEALQIQKAIPFFGIALVCIALAERRLFLVVGLLGILAFRLSIGLIFHPSIVGFVIAGVIAAALFSLIRFGGSYSTNSIPDGYSDKEMLVDVISLPLFGYLIFIFPRIWMD